MFLRPSLAAAALVRAAPAALALALVATTAAAACDDDADAPLPSLLSPALSAREKLRRWRSGSTLDRLNRADPADVEPTRRVLVVVGITGGGKSSTAGTLAGRSHRPFATSNTAASVTQAADFRDYDFVGEAWRVVDTPGLEDTHKDPRELAGELARLARFAPHGVSAFVVVVPRGRFTGEQERALRALIALFGPAFTEHAILAVTSATDSDASGPQGRSLLPRDALLDEVNRLPLGHFYRRFVEALHLRVVPVENRVDPHRTLCRLALHQRVLDLEAEVQGRRYDAAALLERATRSGAADGTSFMNALAGAGGGEGLLSDAASSPAAAVGAAAGDVTMAASSMRLQRCTNTLARKPATGRLTWTLECEVAE